MDTIGPDTRRMLRVAEHTKGRGGEETIRNDIPGIVRTGEATANRKGVRFSICILLSLVATQRYTSPHFVIF